MVTKEVDIVYGQAERRTRCIMIIQHAYRSEYVLKTYPCEDD